MFWFSSYILFAQVKFHLHKLYLLPQVISRFREINFTLPRYILFAQEILYLGERNWQGFSVSVSLASSSFRLCDVMAGVSILRVYDYLEDMGVPLANVQRMWVTR